MQYTHINKLFKAEDNRTLAAALKVLVFLITCIALIYVLNNKGLLSKDLFKVFIHGSGNTWLLFFVCVLLPVNWGLEALKWQLLVKKNEPITFAKSYNGILSGLTLAFVTPNGIGDYAGRLMQLEQRGRMKNIGFLFFNRLAQLQITLLFGALSLVYLLSYGNKLHATIIQACLVVVVLLLIGIASGFLLNHPLLKKLKRNKVLSPLYSYFSSLKKLTAKEILKIFGISFFRYLVFSTQFILLLSYFQMPFAFVHLLMGTSFIFMAKSVLPSYFDLGVREAAAIYFFSIQGMEHQVLAASLALWLINIVLPSIAGLIFLPGMKIFVK